MKWEEWRGERLQRVKELRWGIWCSFGFELDRDEERRREKKREEERRKKRHSLSCSCLSVFLYLFFSVFLFVVSFHFFICWAAGPSFVSCCCGVNKTVPRHPAVKIRSVDSLRCLCRLETTTKSTKSTKSTTSTLAKSAPAPSSDEAAFKQKNNAVRSPLSHSSISKI